jgi:hypothetical protein
MAAEYFFREFSPTQQETLARAVSVYKDYRHILAASQAFKGSMHWKKIKGKEYLYKYRDRYGNGESLGPRSPETESLFADFTRQRRELTARLAGQREQLAAAGRFCRAALIHRVPEPVVRIVRRLELSELARIPLMVIGTHALHAFEFAAEVFIQTPKNAPFWSDSAQRLTLAATTPIPPDRLLALLLQADRSFHTLSGADFQAANKTGFRVRLQGPPGLRTPTRSGRFDASLTTVPAESGDLTALLNAPKFSQVVIGMRGTPATMTVPDPRVLALHQLWLSQQEDRNSGRRHNDRIQAMALAELILRYLPQYDFFSSQLRLFPPEVARYAHGLVEGYEFEP